MSLRTRFTVLTALVVAGVVILLGSVFFVAFSARLRNDVDSTVAARATGTRAAFTTLTQIDTSRPSRPSRRFLGTGPEGAANIFSIGHSADGGQVALSANATNTALSIAPETWRSAGDTPSTLSVTGAGQDYAVAVVRLAHPVSLEAQDSSMRTVDEIAFAESLAGVDSTLASLRVAVVASSLFGLLLAAVGGWLVARRSVAPITQLSHDVLAVGRSGDVTRRVPRPRTADEIGTLADAFNESLAGLESVYHQLEELLARQQRFTADASHELRTPLTTIRTDLEVLRRHPRLGQSQRNHALDTALVEMGRLSRLVTDLLALARADAGISLDLESQAWADLAATLHADGERVCAPRQVTLDAGAGQGQSAVDEDALRRAFGIIFENIAHHTPESASVWLSVRAGESATVLTVEDDGPGVTDEQLPHLFDRFYQADASRHTTGSGLGLAIALGLVEAHGGSIIASRSDRGGLRLSVTLPHRSRASR